MRIHNTNEANLTVKDIEQLNSHLMLKPRGLWYGINGEWHRWCKSNVKEYIKRYDYVIDLDMSKILCLRSSSDIRLFIDKYDFVPDIFKNVDFKHLSMWIDWQAVAKKYDGIEIDPYEHNFMAAINMLWYYIWDCSSGCVWNKSAIKSIKIIKTNSHTHVND